MNSALLVVAPAVPTAIGLLMLFVRKRGLLHALDAAGALFTFGSAIAVTRRVTLSGPLGALGVLRADALTVIFLLLIGLLSVASSAASIGWVQQELAAGELRKERVRYYFALVQGFIATMLVTVLADNLGVLWIAMEGTTITSALLVGFHGHKQGLEAAWKYIIVTTIGISFGLFGTVLVYGAAAHAQGGVYSGAMNWSSIVAVSSRLDPGIVRIGFIFVMVGYGTKAGLAPVHMWLPDAHSQAPTPVSALLSGALIKCALYGILRFHTIARNACGPAFSETLWLVFGLVSVVVATPFILVQHDLKRLLGYHSVEHVGIVALGLGFGGRLGTFGALLHVINHGITKALTFLVAGDAIARFRSRDMRMIKGYLAVAPWAATLLLMGALSLAGMPPFSIFISELMIVRAGIGARHLLAVAVFLLMVVIIFAGLIHHAGQMVFGVPPEGLTRGREAWWPLFGMFLLTSAMILLGIYIPAGVDQMIERATEVVLG
jgi:hydrogenase-4 component F